MEKFKAIMGKAFWGMFGLALLLPLVAWWMATGALATSTKARKDAIDAADKGIPKGESHPNQDYIDRLKVVNKAQSEYFDAAAKYLWDQQAKQQTWPDSMKALMAGVRYREKGPTQAAQDYRNSHYQLVRQVWQSVSPYNVETGKGSVLIDVTQIPHIAQERRELGDWTWPEIWDAQEDLWLTKELMDAISEINKGSTSITDSVIREVTHLELRGGSRTPAGGGADMAAAGDPGMMPPGAMMPPGGAGMPGGPGQPGGGMKMTFGPGGGTGRGPGEMAAGGGGGGGGQGVVDIPLEEEFGSDQLLQTSSPDGMAAPGGDMMGAGAMPPPAMGGAGMPGGMPGGAGMPGGDSKLKKRYIDDDPQQPYKTRGFYLRVVMMSPKVPDFLARLAASKYPVQVVRVNQVDRQIDFTGVGITGGSSMPGGAGGGMAMPGRMAPGGIGAGRGGAGLPGGGGFTGGSGFPGGSRGLPGGGTSPRYGLGANPVPPAAVPGRGFAGPGGGAGMLAQPGTGSSGQSVVVGVGNDGTQQQLDQVALNDPGLVEVAIAGIFTIYQPPESQKPPPEATGEGQPAGTPATPPAEPVEIERKTVTTTEENSSDKSKTTVKETVIESKTTTVTLPKETPAKSPAVQTTSPATPAKSPAAPPAKSPAAPAKTSALPSAPVQKPPAASKTVTESKTVETSKTVK